MNTSASPLMYLTTPLYPTILYIFDYPFIFQTDFYFNH